MCSYLSVQSYQYLRYWARKDVTYRTLGTSVIGNWGRGFIELLDLNPTYKIYNLSNSTVPISVGDPWHFGADPDPRLRISD